MALINFFSEETDFVPSKKLFLRKWIKQCVTDEGARLQELNFIFCSDAYLLQMNQKYLRHDTLTDIITFDNAEKEGVLAGDIFISVERVQENAAQYQVAFFDELCRILIHGTLHLLGYTDKTKQDKLKMTAMEDRCLEKRSAL
ncbi:rRNA maturation RNase YbeY [Pedobacter yulinensis]|uniref:Endoribonuclease YbeY n=1 Tax=Pedobacter yulinensis TaxID=2126353 RepID=A0A2T3HRM2_9SPHI|nr:rRNA maturation RNase YbeY [Pedobacter yulinensis]PST85066.1 rRNA maturation RNase YbeY [Pedobacter yulinensis]